SEVWMQSRDQIGHTPNAGLEAPLKVEKDQAAIIRSSSAENSAPRKPAVADIGPDTPSAVNGLAISLLKEITPIHQPVAGEGNEVRSRPRGTVDKLFQRWVEAKLVVKFIRKAGQYMPYAKGGVGKLHGYRNARQKISKGVSR